MILSICLVNIIYLFFICLFCLKLFIFKAYCKVLSYFSLIYFSFIFKKIRTTQTLSLACLLLFFRIFILFIYYLSSMQYFRNHFPRYMVFNDHFLPVPANCIQSAELSHPSKKGECKDFYISASTLLLSLFDFHSHPNFFVKTASHVRYP